MTSDMPGNGNLVEREESLLVVIDMQERLLPAMAHRETATENTKRPHRLLRYHRAFRSWLRSSKKLGPTVLDLTNLKQTVITNFEGRLQPVS